MVGAIWFGSINGAVGFRGADTITGRSRPAPPRRLGKMWSRSHDTIMQLTRDSSAVNFIRAWEPGRVRVADRWVAGNVIVGSDEIIESWTTNAADRLTIVDLEPALALQPTIIVLGTGTEHLLPDVELMAAGAARSVGLEIMNTPAACRTFNVLLQEQRRVVAALLNP
jgi:uncharacterized protein